MTLLVLLYRKDKSKRKIIILQSLHLIPCIYKANVSDRQLWSIARMLKRTNLKSIGTTLALFFSVNLEVVLDFLTLLNKYNICTLSVLMPHLCWCKAWFIEVDNRVVYQSSGNVKLVTEHTNKCLRTINDRIENINIQ